MKQHFSHIVLKSVGVSTKRGQLDTLTVAPQFFFCRRNDLTSDNFKNRLSIIHTGQIEPVSSIQFIWLSLVIGIQTLLPKYDLGGEAAYTERFERIFLYGNLTKEGKIICQFRNFCTVQKLICQKRRRCYNRHDPTRLEELGGFDTIVHLTDICCTIHIPFQIERRISNHIIKAHIRLIETNILVFQIGSRIEIVRDLVRFDIQLTAVKVCLNHHEITEVCHTRGKVSHCLIRCR